MTPGAEPASPDPGRQRPGQAGPAGQRQPTDRLTAARVSAIVVNYQASAVLAACVASLLVEGVGEVVVVDNGDCRGPYDPAAGAALDAAGLEVTWVAPGHNAGYGSAVNLGVRSCHGDAWLVCNPDIVLCAGALERLVETLDGDMRVGVVGPRLLNLDGSIYPSARAFPSLADAAGHGLLGMVWPRNPFSRRYRLLDWDHAERRPVDWVSGACFLIRRQAWDDIGGFDPSYFMYMEDVDLCWRAGRAGWDVVYQPSAEVVHAQGVSADIHPYRMIVAHHRSLWQFARRSTEGYGRALLPLVGVGVALRSGAACVAKWRDARGGRRSRQAGTVE